MNERTEEFVTDMSTGETGSVPAPDVPQATLRQPDTGAGQVAAESAGESPDLYAEESPVIATGSAARTEVKPAKKQKAARARRKRPDDPAARPSVRVDAPGGGPSPVTIGVIADTHGRLPASVPRLFEGVVHIVHAGDVGKRNVLRRLEAVAPVTAVSGNVDRGKLLAELPVCVTGEAAGVKFLVVHKRKHLKRRLSGAKEEGVRLIVTGHLHEPSLSWEDGVLFVNPGTATSPEEGDPAPTVALVTVIGPSLAVTFLPVIEDAIGQKPDRARGQNTGAGERLSGDRGEQPNVGEADG